MKHNDIRNWISSQRPRTILLGERCAGLNTCRRKCSFKNGQRSRQPNYSSPPRALLGKAKSDKVWIREARSNGPALVAAGPGSGPAGWSASQALGLSTQLPATPLIAVPGRPPKGLAGVNFVGRSNLSRCDLNQSEIAVLEVMRDFPDFTDRSKTWADAATQIHNQIVMGRVDRNRLLTCARNERNRKVRDRLKS